MNLRLLEINIPHAKLDSLLTMLEEQSSLEIWQRLQGAQSCVRVILKASQVEQTLNLLREKQDLDNARVLILPVEAAQPMPSFDAADQDGTSRLSREEIYAEVAQNLQLSWTQIAMVVLSAGIAAIGLLKSSETIIIGAMVLAPLLQPIMGLAVATVLGDQRLVIRALKVSGIQITLAMILAIGLGTILDIDPDLPEITTRVSVGLGDVALAIAAGIASALSLTTANRNGMVGVMVAVALLPPLVVLGLLIGTAEWSLAVGALLLVLTNVICLNLAATITLAVQNIEPQQQQWRAQQYTQVVVGAGLVLVLGILGIISWRHPSALTALFKETVFG